jgi:hypothetical protein
MIFLTHRAPPGGRFFVLELTLEVSVDIFIYRCNAVSYSDLLYRSEDCRPIITVVTGKPFFQRKTSPAEIMPGTTERTVKMQKVHNADVPVEWSTHDPLLNSA